MNYEGMTGRQRLGAYYMNLCDLAIMAMMAMFGCGFLLCWIAVLSAPVWLTIWVAYQLIYNVF